MAASTGGTGTTFDVTAGTLDITVPPPVTIGGTGGAPGTTISGSLGPVIVADTRATSPAGWTTTVTSEDFTNTTNAICTVTKPPAQCVIAASGNVTYNSGSISPTTGTGTFVGSAGAVTIAGSTAATHTGGTGNNSAQWNPTIAVSVPLANVSGTYSGTVTHSVAGS
jgi:hypothetical protein